ncbi:hypothetical protein IPM62_02150 [Candidatus Woesebacteria bacterium]|nr:MAG: hypothetical protein IPM62_02150 [Candidatus Woesebacteria bacterium]
MTQDPGGNNNSHDFPNTVGILYSEVKREYFPTEDQYLTEKDALHDAQVIATYLDKLGLKTYLYPGVPDVINSLKKDKPDMVINLVGSVNGQEYLSSTIPGMLESLDIPYTGAGILGESLAYNKFLIKELLKSHGIPVPNFQLLPDIATPLSSDLRFPLISKLNEIHGGVEITNDSVSNDEKHLRERVKYLIGTYKQPVVVEEFIAGKEVTAMLLEGLNKKVYMAEKVFKDYGNPNAFATFEDQWLESGKDSYRYEKFSDSNLSHLVKKAFDVTRMSDYGKFDVRIDQSGRYYFIDSNSNPAFGPKELYCALSLILDLYGINFGEIVKRLLMNTMRDARGKEKLSPVEE